MELKIVWRNQIPLIRTKRTLQRIRKDQFAALMRSLIRNSRSSSN